ncbi:MAG: hypothetical protein Q9191_001695 [Dirinaria sp. TL-2023a]
MLLKNTLSLLTWVSLAVNVHSGLIPKSDNGVGLSALEPRLAPQLEERAPTTEVDLVQRAPRPLLSDYENSVLRALSEQIRDKLKKKDLIFFVGNSGSYLIYPFDKGSYNMNSLPLSKSKIYKTNQQDGKGQPTNAGLDGYWDRVLKKRLNNAAFDRIVVVDHSGTGKSVDGFRKAFVDVVNRAKDQKKIKSDDAKEIIQTPWHFINVVDWRRRPGSNNPTKDPTSSIIKKITKITFETPDDVINTILADEDKHPRVACEYWPSRWSESVKKCWEQDGTLEAAEEQRKSIEQWNQDNGGLISDTNPEKTPSEQKPDEDKVVGQYEKFGYKYTVRKDKNGKLYVERKKSS